MYKKIYIEITNICNLNCSFCSKVNRKKEEMTPEKFSIILDKIKPYTSYIYLHVKGEPLLHSKFDEILSIAQEKKFKVNITTNATLLSKQISTIIKHSCIRQINVSLHSNLESYEYIYNTIMSTKKIIEETNIVFSYRIWNLKNNQNLQNKKVIEILEKEYNTKITTFKSNIKLSDNLYLNFNEEFNWPNLNNNIYNDYGKCYGLKNHIAILVDGSVVPCCLDSDGIVNLGNIYFDDLEDIINSERYQVMLKEFQNNKKFEELCKHCDFIKF